MLLVLVSFHSVQAETIHVPSDYSVIQDAIDATSPGDIVEIAAGVYDDLRQPGGTDTTRCVVSMKSGITLRGAGIGQTILDPDFGGRGIHCDGVMGSQIEGITVRHAHAELFGAGLYCTNGSSPNVTDCEFTEGTDGGVICTAGSSPHLESCLITNNEAKQGGGISAEDASSPIVSECTITGNSAPAGGGVFVRADSGPSFHYCVIANNFLSTANGAGGGVGVINATLTLFGCDVTDNVATGPGGGIAAIDGGDVRLINCNVLRNSTTDSYGPGGGIHCESSILQADHTVIADNWVVGAGSDGGGIYFFFTETGSLEACTVVGNETNGPNGHGGGIACFLASPTIERSIVAFNLAGEGLYCVDEGSVPQVSCTDVFGNFEGDTICGDDLGGNFSLDPLFCDAGIGNYSLTPSSPCLPGNHPNGNECDQIGALGPCDPVGVPETIDLSVLGNHYASPNPLRTGTNIHFTLQSPSQVRLTIYDAAGRQVGSVESRGFPAGENSLRWDARDERGGAVQSGLYLYALEVDGVRTTGQLVLVR